MSSTPTTTPSKAKVTSPTSNHLTVVTSGSKDASSSPARNTRSRSPSPAPPKSPGLSEQMAKLSVKPPTEFKLPAAATSSTTGIVYDPRCLLHQANYSHVEKPARALDTMKLLVSSGVYQRCVHVPSRQATDAEIESTHPPEHVAAIDGTEHLEYKPDELDSETEGDETMYPDCKFLDSDTYVNRYSAVAARLSIGGLIDLIDTVVSGKLKNGFAVVRPPGHHADSRKASGFCLYNTVAVAAEAIRKSNPNQIKKIIIVDWDVHHGDGTQALTYQNPNILYFSIHRYQGGAFYPHTGSMEDTGGEQAPGSNINVPLNFKGLGDDEYMEVFKTLLVPVIGEFCPDLILVSAGFDCALGDPLGGMEVSSEGFAHLTRMLMDSVPHGRVVLALEGGYNVRAVSEAVQACTKTLLGEALPTITNANEFLGKREIAKLAQRKELFRKDLLQCIKIQKKFWKCLTKIPIPDTDDRDGATSGSSSSSSAAPTPTVAATGTPAPTPTNVTIAPPSQQQ